MRVTSEEELYLFAEKFAKELRKGERARVVALSGELGAGKTAFTQALGSHFGILETVTSPTFVIENIYRLSGQKWKRFIHIDAYRLKGMDELLAIGWNDIVVDPDNIIVIEWPERVEQIIPDDAIRLTFTLDGDVREITREK